MAQDVRTSKGVADWFLSKAVSPTDHRERPKTTDFSAGDAADFQVSLSTSTSIAGLTAFSRPSNEYSGFAVDTNIATDPSAPLSYQSSDQVALSSLPNPVSEDGAPSIGATTTQFTLGESNAVNGAESANNAPSDSRNRPDQTPEVRLEDQTARDATPAPTDVPADASPTTGLVEEGAAKAAWSPEDDLSNSIPEDSAAGAPLYELDAMDQYGDPITYVLTDAEGNALTDGLFEIVDNVIVLTAGMGLDFETTPEHTLYFTTRTESGTSGPWPIVVTVTDVAENIVLDDTGVAFVDRGVVETSITGGAGDDAITSHTTAALVDGGAGNDTINGGAGSDRLTGGTGDDVVSGGSGFDIAYFTGAWADYAIAEADGVYTVTDLRPGSPDGTDTITGVELFRFADGDVTPADALNDGPTLTASDGMVDENAAGVLVGAVTASDPDAGDSLTFTVDDARFEVVDGQLRLRDGEALDHETEASVDVTVTVTDSHGASASQVVTVTVTDVNESGVGPVADRDADANSVAEDAAPGTVVGLTAFASDPDGGDTVTYRLSDDAGGRFAIDPATGVVSVAGGLDFETAPAHVIEVTATSSDGSTSVQSFTIGVADADEAPAITSDGGGDRAALTMAENGTAVTTLVADTDAGETLSYAISGGADATLFAIDPGTGALRFIGAPDFEAPGDADGDNAYEVTVTASDGRQSDTQTLTVTVTDTNEGPALTVGPPGVDENDAGARVASVAASDPDAGDSLTLTVDDARFEVVDGQLRLREGEALDHETEASIDVTVTVTDAAGLSDSQTVTVTVADVNEGPVLTPGSGTVAENAAGATILDHGAADPDAGDSLTLTVDDARFEVVDGQLRLREGEALDHETEASIDVTVTATDSGGLSTTETYTVTVTDTNEGPTLTASDGTVDENAAGAVVGAVTAADPDAGDSLTLTVDDARFEVVDGQLRLREGEALDYEPGETLTVTVTATDAAGLSDSQTVTVTIGDTAETFTLDDTGVAFVDRGVAETRITGGAGDDTITGHTTGARIDGGAGNDQITGVDGNDFLIAGDGDDSVTGAAGNDTLYGISGDNTLDGGAGNDIAVGGTGSDTVTGGDGDDVVVGLDGADVLSGGAGDDILYGAAGDDTLDGGSGTDMAVWVGNLIDYDVSYDASTATFTITDENAGNGDGTDIVTGVETFWFNGTQYSTDLMIRYAEYRANEAPTDLSFDAANDLDGNLTGPEQTVVTGQIQRSGENTSVDHWEINHGGGDLKIDTLAQGFQGSRLDSQIRLFRDNGDGTYTQVVENDDGAAGEDGSRSQYDSYIGGVDLAAGTYILAIGSYPMSERDAVRTSTDYHETERSGGVYQITLTGYATMDFAENPAYGGNWGDPGGQATVVSTTTIETGLGEGTVVADVSGVADADAGDTHTFALSDDAGGAFEIDRTAGEISVTGDPRANGPSQDTISVVVTDASGASYTETIGLTFGTTWENTLNGTSYSDIIYAFDGDNTITGGAGDDTIVGGAGMAREADWITVENGDNLQGTGETDYYRWTAGEGESAVIRFNNSAMAGDGDGGADYVVVETTNNEAVLTIGDFDFGVDRIVLPEDFLRSSIRVFDDGADYKVQYADGNVQMFRIYGLDGQYDISEIFTTTMPEVVQTGGDTVVFDGGLEDFSVGYNAATGTFTITDLNTSDDLDEGTDIITGVERFTFDGVDYDAAELMTQSSVAADSFDYDSGNSREHLRETQKSSDEEEKIFGSGDREVIYARGGGDYVQTDAGDDVIYGGSGNDTVLSGAGDDTIFGGTGSDTLVGGDGNDIFVVTAMQGDDTVNGGSGWIDVLELSGIGGDATVEGQMVDGEGWTLLLENGHSVTAETLNSLELSPDAIGVITFDEGGTIDFTGIEKINF